MELTLRAPARRGLVQRDTLAVFAITAAVVAWIALEIGGPATTRGVDNLAELGAALAAGAACLAAAARGGAGRMRWALLGASSLAWAAGQGVWCYYEEVRGVEVPIPSLADAGFLLAVPLAVLGLRQFRPPVSGFASADTDRRLDRLFAMLGVLFIVSLASLALAQPPDAAVIAERVVSLAYPAGDLMMVAVAVIAYRRLQTDTTSLGLVVVGIFALTVSDSAFAYLAAANNYSNATILDMGWILGFLLIALGARRATRPVALDDPPLSSQAVGVAYIGSRLAVPRSSPRPWAPKSRARMTPLIARRAVHSAGLALITADAAVVLYDLRQLFELVI